MSTIDKKAKSEQLAANSEAVNKISDEELEQATGGQATVKYQEIQDTNVCEITSGDDSR